MNYNSIGELLKALRKSRKISQEEACKGICDRRTYIRWEKNEMEPSNYNMHLLSNRFNYDLQAYYKLLTHNNSIDTWNSKQKLAQYSQTAQWTSLKEELERLHNNPQFQTGENASLLYYFNALYYYNYKQDYNTSITYCIQGLKFDNSAFTTDSPTLYFYSNIGLCLLNCLACNLNSQKENDRANHLFSHIIQSIDNKLLPEITYYQSTQFEIKIYQTTIHNLTLNYQRNKDYKTALLYSQKGIDFLIHQNSLYELSDLFKLKFVSLYELMDYESASLAYQQYVTLSQLQKQTNEFVLCKAKLESEYPLLTL